MYRFSMMLMVLVISAICILAFGCQKPTRHVVVETPHPTSPQHANALYFGDSTALGLTKPPYDYTSPNFAIESSQVLITVTCYGQDQSNYLGNPYHITVDVYSGAHMTANSVVTALCSQSNPGTVAGIFVAPAFSDKFHLVIHADGPWTVEVDHQ